MYVHRRDRHRSASASAYICPIVSSGCVDLLPDHILAYLAYPRPFDRAERICPPRWAHVVHRLYESCPASNASRSCILEPLLSFCFHEQRTEHTVMTYLPVLQVLEFLVKNVKVNCLEVVSCLSRGAHRLVVLASGLSKSYLLSMTISKWSFGIPASTHSFWNALWDSSFDNTL